METICLRLGKELKEKLTEEAKQKGLSLNAYIRLILNERSK